MMTFKRIDRVPIIPIEIGKDYDEILEVTNPENNYIVLMFGNGDGTFEQPVAYTAGADTSSIIADDFNNDTKLDLVVAYHDDDNVSVLIDNGDRTFQKQTTYAVGDNRQDIVITNSGTDNVGIFLSNDTGTFSSQMTYSTVIDSQPNSVAILDFNNDTRLDIVVANYGSNCLIVFFGD